jgi:glycosyltransferase involved in cell wall biosynthesis
MKLVIQIPCLNEASTLPQTLADLPRSIPGIDTIEILVVDDGSTDGTPEVAEAHGAHHVLKLGTNRGLGFAFSRGIEKAVSVGADIVVNTDGDNQYCGADIAKLVQPILEHRADFVVGCRPINDHPEFGWTKRLLQKLGSATLRSLSRTHVRDAASGFRAFSRETCKRLFVYSRFSYCMETLIQAGNSQIRVSSVDVGINRKTRDSRLFKSIPEYIWKSGTTMLAMFVLYRPGRFFGVLAGACFAGALAIGLRFLFNIYVLDHPDPHRTYLPSLVLLAILALTGVMLAALGVLAELIRAQRMLTEEMLFLRRRATASRVATEYSHAVK